MWWQCAGTHCNQAPWTYPSPRNRVLVASGSREHPAPEPRLLESVLQGHPNSPSSSGCTLAQSFQRSLPHLPIRGVGGLSFGSKATKTGVLSAQSHPTALLRGKFPLCSSIFSTSSMPRKITQLICLWFGVYPCTHITLEAFWRAGLFLLVIYCEHQMGLDASCIIFHKSVWSALTLYLIMAMWPPCLLDYLWGSLKACAQWKSYGKLKLIPISLLILLLWLNLRGSSYHQKRQARLPKTLAFVCSMALWWAGRAHGLGSDYLEKSCMPSPQDCEHWHQCSLGENRYRHR